MKSISEMFGCMVFSDDVMREKLPHDVYKSLVKTIAEGKTIDPSIAGVVATAMKDWAIEKGATHFTHWFQPMTGITAEKHDSFISPVPGGKVMMEFSGKELIKGESDASSFPSGGLRATFEARGYTAWDPASYAFVKGKTLYIPTAYCSYTGEALDTKTPLLRSMDAIGKQALRIVRLFGDTTAKRVNTTVGAEQEYFLIDRKIYEKRRDLLYCGRTLFGAPAPKGQELEDHYFGPLKSRISKFMCELDEELWKLGVNAKTKHNEAAPAQHELAPIYITTNLAVDQNLLIMETMKRVAQENGLKCLLHEKPFEGVNGSGKHNNWSLSTDTGKNLLDPGKTPEENAQFLLFLAAVVKAVDEYAALMRISVAHAGNDHRLGADEAPPAIVSMFLGEELEAVIDSIVEGTAYKASKADMMDLGVPTVPVFRKDTTDRNRTSPFAFTGNKFEFRMLGSSQNVAMPNIVLNTAVAEELMLFADRLEALENTADFDKEVAAIIKETFTAHRRVLFRGNGYSEEWEKEAAERGLPNLKDSVSAYKCFDLPENVALFKSQGVMTDSEITARHEIFFENYSKVINLEALTMLDMTIHDIIPAVNRYVKELCDGIVAKKEAGFADATASVERSLAEKLSALNRNTYRLMGDLKNAETKAAAETDVEKKAELYRDNVIPLMNRLRATVDEMETLTDTEHWPFPTYGEMLFRI